MAPLAFFAEGGFDWKNAPTWFGEMSIAARHDKRTATLRIRYRAPRRSHPTRVVLHVPPSEQLFRILVNGSPVTARDGTVILSGDTAR